MNMSSPHSRKQPIDFRKEDVGYVMQRWRAGDSCALIGVGSVGKSNLLQHLSDPEVQQSYMNITGTDEFKAIIIDPNMLGPLPKSGADMDQIRCWAGYELMMHRLFMAFYPFGMLEQDEAQRFYEAYQALQDGTNPLYAYMGLRYFELGLDFFMRRGIRIVFMFDEFEDMLKRMPPKFFQTLRGLRDANKRQMSYLTFTRAPLTTLVDRFELPKQDMEPFVELFNDGVHYVGPYKEIDARRMIENLMSRNQKNYSEDAIRFLMWSTGNYAGLLRSAFRVLDALEPLDSVSVMDDEKVRQLAMRRPIREECQTLWLSLTSMEQHVLKAVAGIVKYEVNPEIERGIAMLVQKRLIRVDKKLNTLHIEPPVFRVFVGGDPDLSE
jgi:hypothetical protein